MIHVAINYTTTEKIGDDPGEVWRYNNTFQNVDLGSIRELMIEVWRGYPYCAQHHHIRRPRIKRDGTAGVTAFRHSDNFWRCNVVSLDFDAMTQRCSIPSLMMDPFISTYAAALYTTRSHTEEKPRTRVVFQTEEVIEDSVYYRYLVKALSDAYTLSDKSAKDACRIFAGSPNCQVVMVGGILSKLQCDAYVRQCQALEEERLAAARARVAEMEQYGDNSVDAIQEALTYIHSEMISYDEWMHVLAAIYSAYPDEFGIALAQSWSQRFQPGEIESKWKAGFNGNITVQTLFWMARKRGWPGALKFESHAERMSYEINRLTRKW